jgi:hypothetical protein
MVGGLVSVAATAAEYSVDASLGIRQEFNDNILLTVLPHREVWGTWTSPGMAFKAETEKLKAEGSAQVDFVRYYGQKDLDITNLFFPFKSSYQAERHSFGLNGSFIRDNTLVGELQQTGVVNRRTQRNFKNASPSWSYGVTEQLVFQADYAYTDVTYTDAVRFFLFDYQLHAANGGIVYKASDRDEVNVSAYYVNYFAPTLGLRSVFPGLQASATHRFSESFSATINGGVRFATSSLQLTSDFKQTDRDTVFLFGVNVEKKWEQVTASARFSRDLFPSGGGFVVQTDQYSATVSWDLTKRLSASIAGNAYLISALVQAQPIPNSRYITVEPRLHWRWTEWWSAELSYRHTRFDVDVVNTSASQNAAFATVTFHLPKYAMSR